VSPFKVFQRFYPLNSLYILLRSMNGKLLKHIMAKAKNSNASYQAYANKHKKRVVFQLGDLVLIHLRKKSIFLLNARVS